MPFNTEHCDQYIICIFFTVASRETHTANHSRHIKDIYFNKVTASELCICHEFITGI